MINEFRRMQQLAGLLTEVNISPIIKWEAVDSDDSVYEIVMHILYDIQHNLIQFTLTRDNHVDIFTIPYDELTNNLSSVFLDDVKPHINKNYLVSGAWSGARKSVEFFSYKISFGKSSLKLYHSYDSKIGRAHV
mgnify:CR=1 FL=1